jgi:hypothetical protein
MIKRNAYRLVRTEYGCSSQFGITGRRQLAMQAKQMFES